MMGRTVFATLVLISAAYAQSVPTESVASSYPRLVRAELPLYPPLAWTAHVTGTIQIQVIVQQGKVVSAEVKSATTRNPQLALKTLENVKTWEFAPQSTATFVVTYTYALEGDETPQPETPRVELDLPSSVRVTAKPFKGTCSDCPPSNDTSIGQSILPRVIAAATPLYPDLPRAARIEGIVRLRLSTDGKRVSAVMVEAGHPLLAASAVENVKTWLFWEHSPTEFEVSFRFRMLPESQCEMDSGGVSLQLPTALQISAKGIRSCDPAETLK